MGVSTERKRRTGIDLDAGAFGGYANKSNYLITAVGAKGDKEAQDRRDKLGAFQPIYAYMTIDKDVGAGVGFKYLREGWAIDTIKPVPGQKELELNDLIIEIEGKSIAGLAKAQQVVIFKQYFKPPKVILKVQRNFYAKMHTNKDAVLRQYALEGYEGKAM